MIKLGNKEETDATLEQEDYAGIDEEFNNLGD